MRNVPAEIPPDKDLNETLREILRLLRGIALNTGSTAMAVNLTSSNVAKIAHRMRDSENAKSKDAEFADYWNQCMDEYASRWSEEYPQDLPSTIFFPSDEET